MIRPNGPRYIKFIKDYAPYKQGDEILVLADYFMELYEAGAIAVVPTHEAKETKRMQEYESKGTDEEE